jgi:hypothetical protein
MKFIILYHELFLISSNFACGLSEFSKYFALGNHELGMLRIYSLSAGNKAVRLPNSWLQ